MQKLVILLHAHDAARPDWAVVDDAGQVSHVVLKGDPETLALDAKDRMNIVIVPAEDVLLTTVTLPKMNRARLLQAIPYALEEQVIEDVDTMHFAAGEYYANEALPVVVVGRAKMTEWLTLLQSFAITPDIMLPGMFALPVSEGVWHVQVNDVAVVRTSQVTGFACDKTNVAEMLALAFASASNQPQEIMITSDHQASLSLALPVKVTENIVSLEQQMEAMARQAAAARQ